MPSSGLKLLTKSEGHLVGSFENVFVSMWLEPATVEQLRALRGYQDAFARDFPDGFGNLAILGAGAGKVSPEVRAEGERITKSPSPSIRATAQVIEGKGFGAAAVRSVAAALMKLNTAPTPTKIFDSLPTGAAWLMITLAKPHATAKLVEAVLQARGGPT